MKHFIVGSDKQSLSRARTWLYGLIFGCMFASCGHPYTTYTDTYFVSNQTEEEIRLVLDQAVMWDTCSIVNPQRAWYSTNNIPIAAGKTIRLHPIRREYKHVRAGDVLLISRIIGASAQLIAGNDTIIWKEHRYDYVYGDEWSIYNDTDWVTTEDKEEPYRYDHTFVIDHQKIERAKQ